MAAPLELAEGTARHGIIRRVHATSAFYHIIIIVAKPMPRSSPSIFKSLQIVDIYYTSPCFVRYHTDSYILPMAVYLSTPPALAARPRTCVPMPLLSVRQHTPY
jgi:hypothetical protein